MLKSQLVEEPEPRLNIVKNVSAKYWVGPRTLQYVLHMVRRTENVLGFCFAFITECTELENSLYSVYIITTPSSHNMWAISQCQMKHVWYVHGGSGVGWGWWRRL